MIFDLLQNLKRFKITDKVIRDLAHLRALKATAPDSSSLRPISAALLDSRTVLAGLDNGSLMVFWKFFWPKVGALINNEF